MQIYDITINPNNVQEVASQGRYIYYYNGSAGGADASITVKHDMSGTAIVLKPGQAFRLDDKERGGGRWLIGNYANTAPILGRIVVGNGRIEDNTVTGSVEVVDGGKNRTKSGVCFMAGYQKAGSAGNFSHVQVWNPVGSGKNLFVKKVMLQSSAVADMAVGFHNAALTDTTAGPKNKSIGNAATSVAQINTQWATGIIQAGQFAVISVQASQSIFYPFDEPLMVPPGFALQCWCGALNTGMWMSAEWYEEAV